MFSELVDEVSLNTNRGVDLVQTAQFANATLRECQITHGAFFDNDLIEDKITTTSASPFVWDKPVRFRQMQAVKYPNGYYPKFIAPGKKLAGQTKFFYSAATYFTFVGLAQGDEIGLAYHSYARRFPYYAVADRPAVYDFTTETYTYAAAFDVDDATRAAARALVSNWELQDWYDTVMSGTVAKVLKRAQDQKSGVAFAEYAGMRKTMYEALVPVNIAAQSAGQNRV